MKDFGDKDWRSITISQGQRRPEQVVGGLSTRDSEIREFLLGGA